MAKTIPPYGKDDAETTIFPENLYTVNFVATADQEMGIMLQKADYPYSFLDFSTWGFIPPVDDKGAIQQPVQLIQPLLHLTNPAIPGAMQRYSFTIAVKAFEDGNYNIYYTTKGELLGGWCEMLNVYKGQVNTFPRIRLVQD